MEISEKSNFRFKALVIALVATILTSTCSTVFGFSVFNRKAADEVTLNRKVEFIGETHFKSDGSARKLFRKGETVRKKYTQEKPGCGIIYKVEKGAKYPIFVLGEGWIAEDQIIDINRYITLDINKAEGGFGLTSNLLVDGEYTTIKSDNTAVVDFKDGVLTANGDGKTTITIKPGNGKEDIELLAVVADGNIELNIPEKKASADLNNVTVAFANEKVKVEGNGHADVALVVDNGEISLAAKGNGEAELKVNDKEIAKIDADGDITATANFTEKSLNVEGKANQKLTLLDKLAIKMKENGRATVDTKHVEVEGGAGLYKEDDKEIASASAGLGYEYKAEDPTGSLKVSVLEQTLIEKDNETIPAFSGLKALMQKIRK